MRFAYAYNSERHADKWQPSRRPLIVAAGEWGRGRQSHWSTGVQERLQYYTDFFPLLLTERTSVSLSDEKPGEALICSRFVVVITGIDLVQWRSSRQS